MDGDVTTNGLESFWALLKRAHRGVYLLMTPKHLHRYPGVKAVRKGVDEFRTYVTRNAATIANYAERHRYGGRVSTAFAESTVNTVVENASRNASRCAGQNAGHT